MSQSKSQFDDDRVNEAIATYFQAIDRGEALDREKFLAENAEIAAELKSFFADMSGFRQLASDADDSSSDKVNREPMGRNPHPVGHVDVRSSPTILTAASPMDDFQSNSHSTSFRIETQAIISGPKSAKTNSPVDFDQAKNARLLDEIAGGIMIDGSESNLLAGHTSPRIQTVNTQPVNLGGYLILEKIGAGGMGQVFKAEHRRMKRIVAIKTLPTITMKDGAAVSRFQREVEAAAKLRHPNIVAADDADEYNGIHFLVMEYVNGKDLSVLVKKNGPLPIATAVNYVLQAARGLEFAHKKGVIHRDVKPSNLLVDSDGVVKILDMGLARFDEHDHDRVPEPELTATGAVMGTVDYMSPEQAFDSKNADARADIYSLGCTLFYLLTGKPLYGGNSVVEKILAHREQPIPRLKDLRPEAPEIIQSTFERMVAKKVEDRFQSMSELIAHLEQCRIKILSLSSDEISTVLSPCGSHEMSSQRAFNGDKTPITGASEPSLALKAKRRWLLLSVTVAAGLFAVFALPSIVVSLKTRHGTLSVQVDHRDAIVKVSNNEERVDVGQEGVDGTISFSVDPEKHQLKVEKDGVVTFPKTFVMESGGEQTIRAQLIPVDDSTSNVQEKKVMAFESPDFSRWMKDVADLPAETQLEAVLKKLRELNPDFDGQATHKIEGGKVTELAFAADRVADLSAVRALQTLRSLECSNKGPTRCRLADLSPIHGMRLEDLDLRSTRIADLGPLNGMPLRKLNLGGTKVSDLSPLEGMPLISLQCWSTGIGSLAPLKDMKLTNLNISNTQVIDLSVLKGMPLSVLTCSHALVNDLSPLDGTPLTQISLTPKDITKGMDAIRRMSSLKTIVVGQEAPEKMAVADFWKKYDSGGFGKPRPIAACRFPDFQKWIKTASTIPAEERVAAVIKKLREHNPEFDGKESHTIVSGEVTELTILTDHITDISAVRALAGLKLLYCPGSGRKKGRLSDLSPLQGMALSELDVRSTQVSDLLPINRLPLTSLIFGYTGVTDLSPLRGMKLTRLQFWATAVADLSPLAGMKLSTINFSDTPVNDISPLKGMPLTNVSLYLSQVSDVTPLDGMSLTQLSLTPARIKTGINVIRRMKTLRSIGTGWEANDRFMSDEFWKKYDAGEFADPPSQ